MAESSNSGGIPIPREHGAWGLMLQPFLAAALLAGRWDWLLVPAMFLVLAAFLIREPLTVLARYRWAGHRKVQIQPVAGWLAAECVAILICFGIAARDLPWIPLLALTAAGIALTAISVWFAVHNRQRSVGLQLVAVAGLSSSAFMAALAATREIPLWTWLLWGMLTLHGAVSVLCVHARLQMRIAAARPASGNPRRPALQGTCLQLLAAIPIAVFGSPVLAIPILFSGAIHAFELRRLSSAAHVRERLQRVGFRMLGISLAHMALVILVLWPLA